MPGDLPDFVDDEVFSLLADVADDLADAGDSGPGAKREAGRTEGCSEERGAVAHLVHLVDGKVEEAVGHVVIEALVPGKIEACLVLPIPINWTSNTWIYTCYLVYIIIWVQY